MAYFPMFIDLKHKPCLIVGGGKIAWHKLLVLWDFQANITMLAKKFNDNICLFAKEHSICLIEKEFESEDILDSFLCVAATDDKELNHKIADICREKRILVNAVDQIEDCDFIFPSYIKEQDVVAAFSSGGDSPVVTQYLKEKVKEILTEEVGEAAKYLGEIRPFVKEQVEERKRKQVYRQLLEEILEKMKNER